jgi:hypothetical protein
MHALAAPQREYEKVTEGIQEANHRMGGSHVLAHESSNLTERDIDNGKGSVIVWSGNIPPVEFNPTPVNPQTYQYQQSIPETMMRARGVSPTAATSQVPAGLSQASGKALQVFTDEGSKRRIVDMRALERWKVDTAQLIIEEARELVAEDPSYKTRYRSHKAIESVSWKDVLLDEDEFVLTIPPASSLSKDPAGKFAQLSEMLNAGAINIEQFRRLYGIPDLEAENELDTADTDIIDRNLEIIALEGRYLSPQPFDNLGMCVTRAGKFYNLLRAKGGIPEARLQLVQNYIADAQALIDQAKAASQSPAPAPMPSAPANDNGSAPATAA